MSTEEITKQAANRQPPAPLSPVSTDLQRKLPLGRIYSEPRFNPVCSKKLPQISCIMTLPDRHLWRFLALSFENLFSLMYLQPLSTYILCKDSSKAQRILVLYFIKNLFNFLEKNSSITALLRKHYCIYSISEVSTLVFINSIPAKKEMYRKKTLHGHSLLCYR